MIKIGINKKIESLIEFINKKSFSENILFKLFETLEKSIVLTERDIIVIGSKAMFCA